jgi:predicted nucleotidyltransferase
MSQARDDDGKFVERTSADTVFELLKSKDEPLTATEIADHLDISNRTALNKLNELNESEPTVIRKQVGANAVIWFIRHGALHEQAFETFADRLTDAVGEDIERIILYGSVARGEAREHSDVDVLIVTPSEQARENVREHASTIGFDITLEDGINISTIIKTTEEMEEQQDRAYIQNVQNDGRVYG